LAIVAAAMSLSATCSSDAPISPLPKDRLAAGTWGGENAGLLLDETLAHVHVGCTYGDFAAPVELDNAGRFNVSGSYLLRAYPVAVGPTMPAQFAGVVSGGSLTLSVAVNDTVEKKLVVLGPVTLTFGKEPRMGPCPICRKPGERATWSLGPADLQVSKLRVPGLGTADWSMRSWIWRSPPAIGPMRFAAP
jgi:hypothetical protein